VRCRSGASSWQNAIILSRGAATRASPPLARSKYHYSASKGSVKWLANYLTPSTRHGPSINAYICSYATSKQHTWISIRICFFSFTIIQFFLVGSLQAIYMACYIYSLWPCLNWRWRYSVFFLYSIFCSIHSWGLISMIFLDMILWHWINWSKFEMAYESEKGER
jgi:hypothetical protein